MSDEDRKEFISKVWEAYLNTGDVPDFVDAPWFASKRLRSLYLRLPKEPRCRLHFYPFGGFGGSLMRGLFGIQPSRLNPQICNHCDMFLHEYSGGAEVDLTILFVDVRGSTTLAENMNPMEFGQLINKFYNTTTNILFESGALVEKLAGDSVTAFFTPGFSKRTPAHDSLEAAKKILKDTGHYDQQGPWVPLGIGIHSGKAFVGSIKSDTGANEIAVLGDTANTGARLSSMADTGEILVSKSTAEAAGISSEGAETRKLELKGRSDPVVAIVL
jgi:adenylate cyclase